MKLWSVILFFTCLNCGGWIVSILIGGGVLVGNSQVMPYSTSSILAEFNLSTFTAMAAGAGIAGLIGLITKQYVFAAGAAAIWVLGLMFNVGNWLLNGFPMMMSILLGGTGLDFMTTVFTALFTLFMFFAFSRVLGTAPPET